ncbi:MAG TPA: DMT family transporter [Ferruginibacter sp.]|jgi:drug/metabolite transporter (DMT)-like permease|nr:DMT family transporter [Ferruginibacter sp.]HMU71659.1 DMT family transporter [Ferruginibacter sp.]HMX80493.1 DMT family transporter [Ferruginibacter sp.]HMZ99641.1 DMT family transporter [Ferruginibacter sp.]HNF01173.1 DMT family transporter [Ferruginibacter sp.]
MKKALLQLHIAVFLAGFTAILGKLITLNEGLLVWFRLLITVSTLGIMLYYQKRIKAIPWGDMLKIFGVGVIVALHWVTFYGSVKYGNVSVALVCFSATGFFTAFFEPMILRRKLSVIEIGLGMMAIAGIYIIFDFHPQYKLGIIFGILSAMGSALFPIFNKRLLVVYEPKTLTLYELGGGLLALTVLVPLYLQKFPASYYVPTATDWLWLFVLAWLCTVLSFDLQLNALKKVSAFTANLTYNLEPVYGIILAFIFFKENENLHREFYLGVLLILLAVVLQMWRISRQYRRQRG